MASGRNTKKKNELEPIGKKFRKLCRDEMVKSIKSVPTAKWQDFVNKFRKIDEDRKTKQVTIEHGRNQHYLYGLENTFLRYMFAREVANEDVKILFEELLKASKPSLGAVFGPIGHKEDKCLIAYPLALKHHSFEEKMPKLYLTSQLQHIFFKTANNIIKLHPIEDPEAEKVAIDSIFEAVHAIIEKVSAEDSYPKTGGFPKEVQNIIKFLPALEFKTFLASTVPFREYINKSRKEVEEEFERKYSSFPTQGNALYDKTTFFNDMTTRINNYTGEHYPNGDAYFNDLHSLFQNTLWSTIESPNNTRPPNGMEMLEKKKKKAKSILNFYNSCPDDQKKEKTLFLDKIIVVFGEENGDFVICDNENNKPTTVRYVDQIKFPNAKIGEFLKPISTKVIPKIVHLYTVLRRVSKKFLVKQEYANFEFPKPRNGKCNAVFQEFFQLNVKSDNVSKWGMLTVDKVVHHVMKHPVVEIDLKPTHQEAETVIQKYFDAAADCVKNATTVFWMFKHKGKLYVYFIRDKETLIFQIQKENNWFGFVTYYINKK